MGTNKKCSNVVSVPSKARAIAAHCVDSEVQKGYGQAVINVKI